MNDYDNIRNLELSSYKSIGSLNEDNLVAANDLSNVISAMCYNLSNMLDKRDPSSTVSGNVIISNDLSVNGKFAQGANTFASGQQSHAEGENTQALGAKSHAEGYNTIANGWASHAEGADYTYAGGQKSHAEGGSTSAFGTCSHTEGRSTIARARYSHVEGACAESLCAEGFGDEYSYVWSGVYDTSKNRYPSHGAGSFSINPKESTNGFFIGNKSFADYLSDLSGDLNGEIQNKLDKRYGGIVSGDVEVYNHDLRVLFGNYIQATDPTHVYNYSQKNTFIQAEEAFSSDGKSYGPANTGSYGYCVLSVINGTNYSGFKLSGDISKLIALLDNNAAGAGADYDYRASKSLKVVLNDTTSISNALFSFALSSQGETMKYQISSIDQANNIVYLKQAFSAETAKLTSLSEEDCINLWENDDNAFYVAGFPEIGNAVVKNFYAQHVEGGSSRAVGKYTHAEGRDNIADVRYSHVEGAHNIAAGMATHAEGFQNKVLGKYAHVEGNLNVVNGNFAHAEGQTTAANGEGSHAEGIKTVASGFASHTEGYQTSAIISAAHAEGYLTYAKGAYSHAEGNQTSAIGVHSHAQGEKTKAQRDNAHAAGFMCEANAWNSTAIGRYSRVLSTDNNAFVWQGLHETTNPSFYESKGIGTFCINPKDSALSNVWIGSRNLSDIISAEIYSAQSHADSAVQQLKSQISSALSTIVADPLSSLTYSSDIDKIISAAVEMRNILSSLYDAMRG